MILRILKVTQQLRTNFQFLHLVGNVIGTVFLKCKQLSHQANLETNYLKKKFVGNGKKVRWLMCAISVINKVSWEINQKKTFIVMIVSCDSQKKKLQILVENVQGFKYNFIKLLKNFYEIRNHRIKSFYYRGRQQFELKDKNVNKRKSCVSKYLEKNCQRSIVSVLKICISSASQSYKIVFLLLFFFLSFQSSSINDGSQNCCFFSMNNTTKFAKSCKVNISN